MNRRAVYDRTRAAAYALRHWDDPNPRFANMDTLGGGGDCTNFTSQALLAGGWPMDYRGTGYDREWWYLRRGQDRFDAAGDDWWSCTWSLPENQFQYLRLNHATVVDLRRDPSQASRLRLGDLVFYDWNGDGRFDHGAIVTAHDRFGRPLVTYRTLSPRPPVRNAHWELPFRGPARRIFGALLVDEPVVHRTAPDWTRLVPCDRRRRAQMDIDLSHLSGRLAMEAPEPVAATGAGRARFWTFEGRTVLARLRAKEETRWRVPATPPTGGGSSSSTTIPTSASSWRSTFPKTVLGSSAFTTAPRR